MPSEKKGAVEDEPDRRTLRRSTRASSAQPTSAPSVVASPVNPRKSTASSATTPRKAVDNRRTKEPSTQDSDRPMRRSRRASSAEPTSLADASPPKLRKTGSSSSLHSLQESSLPTQRKSIALKKIPEGVVDNVQPVPKQEEVPAVGTPRRKARASIAPAASSPARLTRRSAAALAAMELSKSPELESNVDCDITKESESHTSIPEASSSHTSKTENSSSQKTKMETPKKNDSSVKVAVVSKIPTPKQSSGPISPIVEDAIEASRVNTPVSRETRSRTATPTPGTPVNHSPSSQSPSYRALNKSNVGNQQSPTSGISSPSGRPSTPTGRLSIRSRSSTPTYSPETRASMKSHKQCFTPPSQSPERRSTPRNSSKSESNHSTPTQSPVTKSKRVSGDDKNANSVGSETTLPRRSVDSVQEKSETDDTNKVKPSPSVADSPKSAESAKGDVSETLDDTSDKQPGRAKESDAEADNIVPTEPISEPTENETAAKELTKAPTSPEFIPNKSGDIASANPNEAVKDCVPAKGTAEANESEVEEVKEVGSGDLDVTVQDADAIGEANHSGEYDAKVSTTDDHLEYPPTAKIVEPSENKVVASQPTNAQTTQDSLSSKNDDSDPSGPKERVEREIPATEGIEEAQESKEKECEQIAVDEGGPGNLNVNSADFLDEANDSKLDAVEESEHLEDEAATIVVSAENEAITEDPTEPLQEQLADESGDSGSTKPNERAVNPAIEEATKSDLEEHEQGEVDEGNADDLDASVQADPIVKANHSDGDLVKQSSTEEELVEDGVPAAAMKSETETSAKEPTKALADENGVVVSTEPIERESPAINGIVETIVEECEEVAVDEDTSEDLNTTKQGPEVLGVINNAVVKEHEHCSPSTHSPKKESASQISPRSESSNSTPTQSPTKSKRLTGDNEGADSVGSETSSPCKSVDAAQEESVKDDTKNVKPPSPSVADSPKSAESAKGDMLGTHDDTSDKQPGRAKESDAEADNIVPTEPIVKPAENETAAEEPMTVPTSPELIPNKSGDVASANPNEAVKDCVTDTEPIVEPAEDEAAAEEAKKVPTPQEPIPNKSEDEASAKPNEIAVNDCAATNGLANDSETEEYEQCAVEGTSEDLNLTIHPELGEANESDVDLVLQVEDDAQEVPNISRELSTVMEDPSEDVTEPSSATPEDSLGEEIKKPHTNGTSVVAAKINGSSMHTEGRSPTDNGVSQELKEPKSAEVESESEDAVDEPSGRRESLGLNCTQYSSAPLGSFDDDEVESEDDDDVYSVEDDDSSHSDEELLDTSRFSRPEKSRRVSFMDKSCITVSSDDEGEPKTGGLGVTVDESSAARKPGITKKPANGDFKTPNNLQVANFSPIRSCTPGKVKNIIAKFHGSGATEAKLSNAAAESERLSKRKAVFEDPASPPLKILKSDGDDNSTGSPRNVIVSNIPKGMSLSELEALLKEGEVAVGLESVNFVDVDDEKETRTAVATYDSMKNALNAVSFSSKFKVNGNRIFLLMEEAPPARKGTPKGILTPVKPAVPREKFCGIMSQLPSKTTIQDIVSAFEKCRVKHISEVKLYQLKSERGSIFAKIKFFKKTDLLRAAVVAEHLQVRGKKIQMKIQEEARNQ